MLTKKFHAFAQVVGYITIGLLAVYGLLTLVGIGPAWAASGNLALPPAPQAAQAIAPTTLGYVGYLKDDAGNPLNNVYTMTFRIYDNASNPTPLWEETQTGISVSGGVFNVVMGATTPFSSSLFADPDRYLGITIEGYAGELLPRQQFASVPYSLRTERAGGLAAADGDPADAVVVDDDGNVTFNGNAIVSGSTTMSSATMDSATIGAATVSTATIGTAIVNGRVGIGTTSPEQALDVRGPRIQLKEDSTGHTLSLGTWGNALDFNFNTNLHLQGSGGSQIYLNPSGGNVGVGTASPAATLDVNGNINTNGNISWNRASGHLTGLNLTDKYSAESHESGRVSTGMVSSNNSMCFLTYVWFETIGDHDEDARCDIQDNGSQWILSAEAEGTGFMDAFAHCEARCLQW